MARDTDRDWKLIGDQDPYFGVSTEERFRLAHINADALDEFYASGGAEIAQALARIAAAVPNFAPRRALDFGCGAGRLVLAMAPHAKLVVGLDVAPGMLRRARDAAQSRRVRNVRFVEALETDESFDWINSYIVLQHMPPERGYAVLADLFNRLTVGGVCSFQLTLFRDRSVAGKLINQGALWAFDGETARLLLSDDRDPAGTIGMYDYDLNRVLAMMAAHEIEPFGIAPTNHSGAYGVWLFARRHATERAVVPGIVYGPASTPSVGRLLGSGWSFVEEWGVWTDGRQATLDLRIDPVLRQTHVLLLTGHAFLCPELHERLAVAAHVNGKPAGRRLFTLKARDGALALPLTAMNDTGVVRVTLTIDAPRSPDECGTRGDLRLLGFGLERLELQPIQAATA